MIKYECRRFYGGLVYANIPHGGNGSVRYHPTGDIGKIVQTIGGLTMKKQKKDNEYSVFLAIVAIWLMIGGLAQCESASNLDGIRRELGNIRHELNMMKYK